MLEILKVILLGIVEGITEWLPISSTGHMILLNDILKLNVSAEFMNLFLVVIQLGAILAVVLMYFKRLWPFRFKAAKAGTASAFDKDKLLFWCRILVTVLPAVIIGLPVDDWIDEHLYNYPVIALMLILYGVLFIVVENFIKGKRPTIRRAELIGWREALIIGLCQVLALIPGTSRSGVMIICALLLGISRRAATEYAFFVGIPVMAGASLLKIVKFGFHFSFVEAAYLLVGMIVAFVVSVFVIRFIIGYLKKHDFKVFGYYRIALGIVLLLYFFITR